MLAIDLDGTLLDSHSRVPPANLEAVRRAQDAGVLVVLCTGRGLVESRPAMQALDHHGPIILAGGALVSDPITRKTLHRAIIEPNLAGELIDHLDPAAHAIVVLLDPEPQEHDYLVVNPEKLTRNTRWWFEMIEAKVRCVDKPSVEDLHHVLRVGIVGPERVMPPVRRSIEGRFGPRVVVQHFTALRQPDEDVEVLEVFGAGVSKWSGMKWLAAEHGIGLDEVAAIGDQINDVSMIEHAACGVAMGNAVPAVLRVARQKTGSNDNAGVATAIDHMLAGRW